MGRRRHGEKLLSAEGRPPRDWERQHWTQIEQIFEQAERLPSGERGAFVDRTCAGNARLRDRVLALLAADIEKVDSLGHLVAGASPLAGPASLDLEQPAASELLTEEDSVPDRIGAFDIRREIGRGGVSSVFLAERADGSFRKRVALKLVRRGLDTQDILRRLRQERQILARLDHENIARLLDGGSAEDGRPYFVMEYVEGVAIDRFCREQGLDLEDRLGLFMTVCSAVHYAHQNLTIHRDIKPSNILVTDGGVVKLLDFGIAKVLEDDEALTAWQVTGPGLRYMTPAYASPEQIRGEVLSTATDVYSLGVLLFRLLTGAPPYAIEDLPFPRLEETICDRPPDRPSQRINAESLALMGCNPSRLRQWRAQLSGDLDTIVAMALRKEPERRYSSAEQLAEDIRRYLSGQPVRAQPDRWVYRTRKFVGRNVRALAVTAAVVWLLASVVAFYSSRLIEERDRAFQASARAEVERSKSEQVADFVQGIFEVSDPSQALGRTVTAVQLLEQGARRIDVELADQPELEASFRATIAHSYRGLGLFQEAEKQLERSLELHRTLVDPPHESLAKIHRQMGQLRESQGRYDEATRHFATAAEQFAEVLGENDPETAESEADLGTVAHVLGRLDEAEQRYLSALDRLRRIPGPEAPKTLQVESNLVALRYHLRQFAEAESLGRTVLARQQKVLGPLHPDTLSTETTLAAVLLTSGEYAAAEPVLKDLLDRQKQLLGPNHPDVALAANNLAAAYYHLKRWDDAEPLYRQALRIQRQHYGDRHARSVATLLNLADLEADGRGDDDAARRFFEEAIDSRRHLAGDGHPSLLFPLLSLGELELRQDRPEIAERHLRAALEILDPSRTSPSAVDEWQRAEARSLLGESLLRQGDSEAAWPMLEDALRVLEAELGPDHARTRKARQRLNTRG
ncbi:MAG: serine/threonine-protein kinase [Acidobacteriota bacterium]